MEEILENRLGDLGVPLVLNLPVGHGRLNRPLWSSGATGWQQWSAQPVALNVALNKVAVVVLRELCR